MFPCKLVYFRVELVNRWIRIQLLVEMLVGCEMQLGLQLRVLKKQGTSIQTHENGGERLGAKCRHKD